MPLLGSLTLGHDLQSSPTMVCFPLGHSLPIYQIRVRTVGPCRSTEGSWRTPPPVGRSKGKCPGPWVARVQLCLGRDYCCSKSMQPCDYEMNSKHLFLCCKLCCSTSCFDLTFGGRGRVENLLQNYFSESKSSPNKLASAY